VGKKGNVGDGASPDSEELDQEPESQDDQSGKAYEFYEDEDEQQGEDPRPRKEKQVSPQNPRHRPAGPDHRSRRSRVGIDLG